MSGGGAGGQDAAKTKQKSVPKLRFSEFEGEWKFQPIGKFLIEFNQRVPSNTNVLVYSSSRAGLLPQKDYFDGKEIQNHTEYSLVPEGYLTYRHMSDDVTFKFNRNDFKHPIAVSKEYPVFKTIGLNSYFLLCVLNFRKDFKRFAAIQKLGGTRTRLYFKTLNQFNTFLPPSLPEQKKIAAFLGAVDEKLAALQKRRDLLTRYKRGLMQKLFSQTLRFTRDNGTPFPDWQEKRLGDLGNVVGGGTPDTNEKRYWNGDINWFTPSEIKHKYLSQSARKITQSGLENSSAKLLPVGALILSTRATIGDVGIATLECATNQGFQSIIINKPNINEFWYYWLLNNKKELLRRSAGSTFLEIGKSEVININLFSPHPDEQQKIATTLQAMDAKIDAVEAEIEQIETFKKALLQQMFV